MNETMLQTIPLSHLDELQDYMRRDIPLTRTMGLRVIECNGHGLLIEAPLAPNINHASTAFGGSLAATMTLACWGMLWLVLKQRRCPACIVIQESNISYLRPVTSDFIARCQYPSDDAVNRLLTMYERQGKGRIELQSDIFENEMPCVGFRGRFVILPG